MLNSIHRRPLPLQKKAGLILVFAVALIIVIMLRRTVMNTLVIIAGGAAVAFLAEPAVRCFERKLPRNLSALCALLTYMGVLLLGLWLLLPSLIAEAAQLMESLPASAEIVGQWIDKISLHLERYLPGLRFPSFSFPAERLSDLARNTISLAGGIADSFYRISLMVVLGYFFLCDWERLMIRLELLIPRAVRTSVVKVGNAVGRELKLYIRAQGIISVLVGGLSCIGLVLIGVRHALVLGILIGALNMIPYFGPVIGAVPAVLMAIGDGWPAALSTVAVLWAIQQIDSTFISPRIMGSMSGISPAVVLLAIFVGSGIGGIVGMLLAVPFVMAYRTVFRVFVQRYENV